ncbi:MAG: helix-turn-helix transcriptional regulator [Euzebyaceae bacterium]|nr:helix-turn-helix transcriptional regulator [Euzebyaceae bacterium]
MRAPSEPRAGVTVGRRAVGGPAQPATGEEPVDPKDATAAATNRVRDVGAFIREQRKTAQLSLRKLAALAGVSNPYLSQIERGLRKPSAEILQSIAAALRISAETLYVRAGILEEREGDLTSAILSDTSLTDAQRRALLEVYRSFRSSEPGQE